MIQQISVLGFSKYLYYDLADICTEIQHIAVQEFKYPSALMYRMKSEQRAFRQDLDRKSYLIHTNEISLFLIFVFVVSNLCLTSRIGNTLLLPTHSDQFVFVCPSVRPSVLPSCLFDCIFVLH